MRKRFACSRDIPHKPALMGLHAQAVTYRMHNGLKRPSALDISIYSEESI
jgi:hypothetical protein